MNPLLGRLVPEKAARGWEAPWAGGAGSCPLHPSPRLPQPTHTLLAPTKVPCVKNPSFFSQITSPRHMVWGHLAVPPRPRQQPQPAKESLLGMEGPPVPAGGADPQPPAFPAASEDAPGLAGSRSPPPAPRLSPHYLPSSSFLRRPPQEGNTFLISFRRVVRAPLPLPPAPAPAGWFF